MLINLYGPVLVQIVGLLVVGLNYDRNIVQFYGVCVPKDTSKPPMLICELLQGISSALTPMAVKNMLEG